MDLQLDFFSELDAMAVVTEPEILATAETEIEEKIFSRRNTFITYRGKDYPVSNIFNGKKYLFESVFVRPYCEGCMMLDLTECVKAVHPFVKAFARIRVPDEKGRHYPHNVFLSDCEFN